MNSRARITVAALCTVAMLALAYPNAWSTGSSPSALRAKAFHFKSGNIACLYDSGKLRCDIYSGLKPQPTKQCQYFWKAAMLNHDGRATWLCIIDSIYDANAPVLSRGQTWHRDGITCVHRLRGLRCHNGVGHGFFLSRSDTRKW